MSRSVRRTHSRQRHALSVVFGLIATLSSSAHAEVTGTFDAPRYAVAGEPMVIGLHFEDESGNPPEGPIRFTFAVSGSARFVSPAETGTIIRNVGLLITAETDASGVFRIPLDIPTAEPVDFAFSQVSGPGVTALLQSLGSDSAEGRPRWFARAVQGDALGWSHEQTDRGISWSSGVPSAASDRVIVSPPVRTSSTGDSTLRLTQRFAFGQCASGAAPDASAEGGVYVELQSGGRWRAVSDTGPHAHTFTGACADGRAPASIASGSTGDALEQLVVPLRRGTVVRAAVRVVACVDCESEGWYGKTLRLVTNVLAIDVLAPESDGDGDGLTASTEVALGTDPTLADSDADGLTDSAEDASGVFVDSNKNGSHVHQRQKMIGVEQQRLLVVLDGAIQLP